MTHAGQLLQFEYKAVSASLHYLLKKLGEEVAYSGGWNIETAIPTALPDG